MDKKTFKRTIQSVFQNPDPAATKAWLRYSGSLERDGICDASDFRRLLCQELTAIQKGFGAKIAENLYNGGKEFTFNTFELRGASGYLQKGLTIKEISEKVLEGLCDGDGPVPKRPQRQKKHESTR